MNHISRICCYTKTCKHCNNVTFVKENIFGKKLYKCSVKKKKHKEIHNKDCGEFRCNEYGQYLVCHNCNGGAPVKRLKLH